jgi:hypothetical protein
VRADHCDCTASRGGAAIEIFRQAAKDVRFLVTMAARRFGRSIELTFAAFDRLLAAGNFAAA